MQERGTYFISYHIKSASGSIFINVLVKIK